MTKEQLKQVNNQIALLSDEELVKEASMHILATLGSTADYMRERYYGQKDITEQEEYEQYKSELADLYIKACLERGIHLFAEGGGRI